MQQSAADRQRDWGEVQAKTQSRKSPEQGNDEGRGGLNVVEALHSVIGAGSGMQIPDPAVYISFRLLLQLICVAGVCSVPGGISGAAAADQLEEMAKRAGMHIVAEGTSSSAAEKSAVAAFPLRSLSPENRVRAETVINRCTQFRRLPRLQYAIDAALYRYLLEHPDVAVSTWRAMEISQFQMWQTGPQEYEASAADGSEGIADILYRDEDEIIFICEGSYHNLLLPTPLQASALIWFRTAYKPHTDGTHIVTQDTDVFVHFPSAGVAGVAKVLTPVTTSLMDRNLFEVSLYASMMSRAVRDEPEWIVSLSADLDGVLPQRRTELAAVARRPRLSGASGQSMRSVDRWVLEAVESGEAGAVPSVNPGAAAASALRPASSPVRRPAPAQAVPLRPRTAESSAKN